jgi:hypothetical protein
MAKTRKPPTPPPPPPPPPPAETPSPQRKRGKKKGRPSLLDLQRRSLRLQAQSPEPAASSPPRRDPNPSDDDDDAGGGSGRRRQKRLKSVLSGAGEVGPLLLLPPAAILKFPEVFHAPGRGFARGTRGDAELQWLDLRVWDFFRGPYLVRLALWRGNLAGGEITSARLCGKWQLGILSSCFFWAGLDLFLSLCPSLGVWV